MRYLNNYGTFINESKSPSEFMADLYSVGENKPVGYLPYDNIKIYGHDTVENVIKWCKANNKRYKHLHGSTGSGGAFYVYDYDVLQDFLNRYKHFLVDNNVPTTPDEYIEYIEKNLIWEHINPELYKIIGLSFNDKRFL